MNITADGLYPLFNRISHGKTVTNMSLLNAAEIAVYLAGSIGGGILQLQYSDGAGGYVDMTDGALTEAGQFEVHKGSGMVLYLSVTGSTAADFNVSVVSL